MHHAEVRLADDGIVMMGWPGPDYRNPKSSGSATSMTYVYVDDADAHCEQARSAGATITTEPEDAFYGDRRYSAEDPEGHQWTFATHVRNVPREEWELSQP